MNSFYTIMKHEEITANVLSRVAIQSKVLKIAVCQI
jgi:hypothetical protein